MIKNINQARAIQERRVKSGKRGYAKAVRRFIAATSSESYRTYMNSLPVNWQKPAKQQAAA